MKIMEKIKNQEKLSNACLFRSNFGDVKIMPFMPYMTIIMRLLNTSWHEKITSVGIKSVIFTFHFSTSFGI